MTEWSQVLGGLGILGLLATVLLAVTFLLVMPFWAIFDVIASRREGGTRVVLVLLLVLTWGWGGLIYGLFGASTRALRVATIASIVLPLLILIPSLASLFTGAGLAQQAEEERRLEEDSQIAAQFQPESIAADAAAPFQAVHIVGSGHSVQSAALATFDLNGVRAETARDIDREVRHVAHDAENDRYFAVTRHDFGTITPSTGRFAGIDVDPTLAPLSWPAGVAFDSRRSEAVVVTSHGETRFFRYHPDTADWSRSRSILSSVNIVALAYSNSDDSLYAVSYTRGSAALDTILRFNAEGALIDSIALDPVIPIDRTTDPRLQLHADADRLVLIRPDERATPPVLVVDAGSGRVYAPEAIVVKASSPR